MNKKSPSAFVKVSLAFHLKLMVGQSVGRLTFFVKGIRLCYFNESLKVIKN